MSRPERYPPVGPLFRAMQLQDQEEARDLERRRVLLRPFMGGREEPPAQQRPYVDPSLFPEGSSTRRYLEEQLVVHREEDEYRKAYIAAEKRALKLLRQAEREEEEPARRPQLRAHMRVSADTPYPPQRAFVHPDLLFTQGTAEHARALETHNRQMAQDAMLRTQIDAARAEARDDALREAAAARAAAARSARRQLPERRPPGAGAPGAGTGGQLKPSSSLQTVIASFAAM